MPGHPPKAVQVKSNFLRKGMGRGGSPTEFDQGIIDQETGRKFNLSSSNLSNDMKAGSLERK